MSRYTREFRKETVALLEISGKTVPELSQELGINPKSLYRWRSQYGDKRPVSNLNRVRDADDLEAEMKRLRRENKVLQQERDILKKAISIFSRSQ